ncbi:hypothetical protein [Breoghania sp. L-A4]|uniref:hypothetical protein n=1 Tax=Breoghania sp. L-A4 TaxID=2304600 RepID=UPI0013C3228B|nr:hypothetical protein [Breoghania sp. L-A4]
MEALHTNLLALDSPGKLPSILKSVATPTAVIVDGKGADLDLFVKWIQAVEQCLAGRHVPLICLASTAFKKPVAIRPDAILTHPVPAQTVVAHTRAMNRLITKRMEADVRTATLQSLEIALPKPNMPVSGGSPSNGPALLVVGTRGHFSQIESVLGAKISFVGAMTADMANLYLTWRNFDAVILDQENAEAIDTLLLLRANPIYHDLPIILLTEGLDADTTRMAYKARANDVMTLRSTRADLFLRLTIGIRTRRLDRSIQETLLACQDAIDDPSGDGVISSDHFKCYLSHAKKTAHLNCKPLTVTRLLIQTHDGENDGVPAKALERPALRLLRRLCRVEDLVGLVGDAGVIAVFPTTDEAGAHLAIRRIRSVMRNTPVTLDLGKKPIKLDAIAKIASVNSAA